MIKIVQLSLLGSSMERDVLLQSCELKYHDG